MHINGNEAINNEANQHRAEILEGGGVVLISDSAAVQISVEAGPVADVKELTAEQHDQLVTDTATSTLRADRAGRIRRNKRLAQ